jgi:3-hydroxybutyryl-CoA dehydratase
MARKNKAADLCRADITVGSCYSFERTLSKEDVRTFAKLTGDLNPLHTDPEFGKRTRYKANVVQGMLAAGLFSALVGMRCPGKRCVYLSQTLSFKRPIFPGERLTVKGTVVAKSESAGVVTLKTEILVNGVAAVSGEAKTLVTEE